MRPLLFTPPSGGSPLVDVFHHSLHGGFRAAVFHLQRQHAPDQREERGGTLLGLSRQVGRAAGIGQRLGRMLRTSLDA